MIILSNSIIVCLNKTLLPVTYKYKRINYLYQTISLIISFKLEIKNYFYRILPLF